MRRAHQRIVLVIGLVGCTTVVLLAVPVLLDHFAEQRLLRDLHSSDAASRTAACEALGKRASLKAIPRLLELLAASDPAAERGLKHVLDGQPVGSCRILAGELDHADPLVRVLALQQLQSHGPWLRESLDPIRGALDDAEPQVRMLAVYALWRMGEDPRSLVPALSAALSERLAAPDQRPFLDRSDEPLLRLGSLACEALKPMLSSSDPLSRQVAASCIGRLDPVPAEAARCWRAFAMTATRRSGAWCWRV